MIKLFSAFLFIGSLIIINSCSYAKADSSTSGVGGDEKGFYSIKDVNDAWTASEIYTNYDLSLEISIDSTDYYIGQQFTFYLKIKNNSSKKISVSNYMLHPEF